MHTHSTPATLHGIVRLAEQHVQLPDALMQSLRLMALLHHEPALYNLHAHTAPASSGSWCT